MSLPSEESAEPLHPEESPGHRNWRTDHQRPPAWGHPAVERISILLHLVSATLCGVMSARALSRESTDEALVYGASAALLFLAVGVAWFLHTRKRRHSDTAE